MEAEGGSREGENESASMLEIGQKNIYKGEHNDIFQRCCLVIGMTRFQLILPVDSQNVTKNRTGHRMHVVSPQICQINCWNNSFQNIYGML